MLKRCAIGICLAICVATPALYGVRIESGYVTAEIGPLGSHVALGPQRILELEPFYIADRNWKTIASFGDSRPETTTAGSVVTQRAAKTASIAGEAIYTLSETGIRIEQSLEIKPGNRAYYAAQGFYLARPVFDGAALTRDGEALHLDPATWKTVPFDHITIATAMGDWEFNLSADNGVSWELWSMCGRTWGPEDRKTFAFVCLFKDVPAAGLKLHLTFEARFLPKPGWATTVDRLIAEQATATMNQLLARYGGQVPDDALPRDPVQRADAVARRVIDATTDLDPTGLDPRSGIIIPEPKERRWGRGAFAVPAKLDVACTAAHAAASDVIAAELARRYGMRFVPYVNLYGKVQELLKAHPEIAEDPDGAKKGGDHAYCPSKPETYKLVFDLLTELVEVTRCDAILSSHDEIGGMVVCPACKAVPPDDLFDNDVNKTAAFLAGKGGDAVALLAYEWTNPRPDDTIVSVDASAKQDVPGLVLGLVALTAVQ